ncbi:MAG: epoxyqueuosine reductase, partial [Alphaproteobacteria bacterium]
MGSEPDLRTAIREEARRLGFAAVGFAAADYGPDAKPNLEAFFAQGRHGDMDWMARNAARRGDAKVLWPAARSIVALGLNYGPADDPLAPLSRPDRCTISVYARGRDYHDVLKKKLRVLARWMSGTFACEVKLFVDTAPVMEKPAAARAGLGWQGKHTNLVSTAHGSWLFLGEIFTTLEL